MPQCEASARVEPDGRNPVFGWLLSNRRCRMAHFRLTSLEMEAKIIDGTLQLLLPNGHDRRRERGQGGHTFLRGN